MPIELFVGGLSSNVDDAGLREAFEKFGEITGAKVVVAKATGESRGFGFVTFASKDDGDKARAEMDGAELDGQSLKVNPAEKRDTAPRKGFRGGGSSGGGGFGRGGAHAGGARPSGGGGGGPKGGGGRAGGRGGDR